MLRSFITNHRGPLTDTYLFTFGVQQENSTSGSVTENLLLTVKHQHMIKRDFTMLMLFGVVGE